MPPRTRLTAIFPILPARDITAAVRYYVERLGFAVAFGDPGDPRGYVGLRRDGIEIHLQFQFEQDFQAGKAGQACLRIAVEDPDALFAELRDREVFHPLTEPQDTTWGTREFGFRDPDGNQLTFMRDL